MKLTKFNDKLNYELIEAEKTIESRKGKDEDTNLAIMKLQEKNLRLEKQLANMQKDFSLTSQNYSED
jgi:hypothetical protein